MPLYVEVLRIANAQSHRRHLEQLTMSSANPNHSLTEMKAADNMRELLIDSVRQYPCLYDVNHPDINNNKVRQKAWKDIATAVNSDVEMCQRSWKTLRDTYVRKMRKRFETDKGTNTIWRFEDKISFLRHHVKVAMSTSTRNSSHDRQLEDDISGYPQIAAEALSGSSAPFQWSAQLESQLIEVVKLNPDMWHIPVSDAVMSEFVKNECNSVVFAHSHGYSQEDKEKIVQYKWSNLFMRFIKEYNDSRAGEESTWVHFGNLQFLEKIVNPDTYLQQNSRSMAAGGAKKEANLQEPGTAFITAWVGDENYKKFMELWQASQHDTIPTFFQWMLQLTTIAMHSRGQGFGLGILPSENQENNISMEIDHQRPHRNVKLESDSNILEDALHAANVGVRRSGANNKGVVVGGAVPTLVTPVLWNSQQLDASHHHHHHNHHTHPHPALTFDTSQQHLPNL